MPKHINKYEKENALNEIHFKEDMYGDVLDVQESELDNQQDNLGCRGKKTISKVCIIFGYAGLVDGMVRRMKIEMDTNPRVIATGGLAELMCQVSETIEVVEPDLTLEGLRIISNSL